MEFSSENGKNPIKKEFQEVGTNKLKDIAVKAVKSKADDVVKKTAQSKDVAKTGLGKKINEKVNDVAEKVAKKSEEAIKEALVDRYPRDQFRLATKLNAWMGCSDEETAKQQFYTSLERTGAGYFDFYLLHALQKGNYEK